MRADSRVDDHADDAGADPSARPAGSGAHRERDGAAGARRGLRGSRHRVEKQLGQRPGMQLLSQAEMIEYAREVLARLQPRCRVSSSVCRRWRWTSGRFPPIASLDGVELHGGHADGTRRRGSTWTRTGRRSRSGAPKRWCCTRRFRATTCRSGSRASCRACRVRKVFTAAAFSEGWGFYAESLGSELGVYADRRREFGQLRRAVPRRAPGRRYRPPCDGLVARSGARIFSLRVPAQSLAEVDRYIARPGQALASSSAS